ncbi:MAG: AIR synthase related protein, partial [Gemmatimonadales bacterium]
MTPYEILLSESQERMLVVAPADRVAGVQAIAAHWELEATPIGRVTDDGMYRCVWQGKVVVEIPGKRLVEDCPVYHPEAKEDPRIAALRAERPAPHAARRTVSDDLLQLLDHPSIASKRWVFEQYDSTVQAGTVTAPGGDAGVIRVRHEDFGIAVTTDCNSRYVLLDPYEGGKAAVAEAARNIACTGARPLGVTDCLNFGSPERPEVFHQFREACRGIAEACRALGTPVTGGNVSFYNESPTGAVDPTPVIGMVGLLARAERAVPSHARTSGDAVLVLGTTRPEFGGSAFWEVCCGFVGGTPPRVDLDAERRLIAFLVAAAESGVLRSAHDCSQGGLGVALAEAAMGGPYEEAGFGLDVDLTAYGAPLTAHELLYAESQARAVITCAPERAGA